MNVIIYISHLPKTLGLEEKCTQGARGKLKLMAKAINKVKSKRKSKQGR